MKYSESTDLLGWGRSLPQYFAIWTICIDECRALVLEASRSLAKFMDHYLHFNRDMLQLLCCVCLFTHLRRPWSPPQFNQFRVLPLDPFLKFHFHLFTTCWAILLTKRQRDKQTNTTKAISPCAKEVIKERKKNTKRGKNLNQKSSGLTKYPQNMPRLPKCVLQQLVWV